MMQHAGREESTWALWLVVALALELLFIAKELIYKIVQKG
jgi:hypothetical protein